jgi:hypothetical protein
MTGHPADCAAQIVHEIVADLTDRRGLRQEWAQIDADIRADIVAAWTKIARDHLEGCTANGAKK